MAGLHFVKQKAPFNPVDGARPNNHPEGNSYIERFHHSLKEEEVWLNEYQSFDQASRHREQPCSRGTW
jgi:hypothetical protein